MEAVNNVKSTVTDKLIKAGNAIFLIMFICIFCQAVGHTTSLVPGSVQKYLFMLILWIAGICAIIHFSQALSENKTLCRCLCALGFILQIIYVWSIYSQVDSDAYVINYIAYHLVAGDITAQPFFFTEYLSFYTNNVPITELLTAIYTVYLPRTMEASWLLLSFLSAILTDLALFYTYRLSKLLASKRFAITVLLLAMPLIVLSESATIFYTDSLTLWTKPAAGYYITYVFVNSQSVSKRRRIIMLCAAGAILAFGIWNKPQVAVIIIAALIVLGLCLLGRKCSPQTLKNALTVIAALSFCFLVFQFASRLGYVIVGRQLVWQNRIPAEHFIAMGLNEERNGIYSEEDVIETKSVLGYMEKKLFLREKISQRIENMGTDGLLRHINRKVVFGASNGTFTANRVWKGTLLNKNPMAVAVQRWFVFQEPGWDAYTAVWIQTEYLLIMLGAILSAVIDFRSKTYAMNYIVASIMRVGLIGIILFLALLECNFRYTYAMLPEMLFLSVCSMEHIRSKVEQARLKRVKG